MSLYVHGYSRRESERLHDQAGAVRDLLHHDSYFPSGISVLEAGCGVGAQTITLAGQNPETRFVSIDISENSLAQAQQLININQLTNVTFEKADIYNLPDHWKFDEVFICYVLEHLTTPEHALENLARVLKAEGKITVIEGDHGSCYFSPETTHARQVWQCLIDVQAAMKGDSLIGRRLYPLLSRTGFKQVSVSPRMVYVDQSKPTLMEAFVGKTIIPMVEGVRDQALERGLISSTTWAQGIQDLRRVADSADGTFCYTFFKAAGIK